MPHASSPMWPYATLYASFLSRCCILYDWHEDRFLIWPRDHFCWFLQSLLHLGIWGTGCIFVHLPSCSLSYLSCDSVQFSRSIMSNSLWPHGLQHPRPPCLSPTPRVYSNSCPLSWWCHPTILSSVVLFSSCLQSFPASGSFPVGHFFTSGGQSIGVSASASVLLMNTQDWFPLGRTGWISLPSKGLSRVFSNTTVKKHQFFGAQLSL